MLGRDQKTCRDPILRGSEPDEYYSSCRAMSIRKNRAETTGDPSHCAGSKSVPERRNSNRQNQYLGLIAKCGFGSIFSGG